MQEKLITVEKAAVEFAEYIDSTNKIRVLRGIIQRYKIEPLQKRNTRTGSHQYSYEKLKKAIEKYVHNLRYVKKNKEENLGMQDIDLRYYNPKKCPYPMSFESY